MALKLITAPASYPLTLAEARAHCRIDASDTTWDDYLTSLIAAATNHVEQITGRALVEQTWDLYLDAFADSIMLPKGPVTSVTHVKYYDTDDVLQTVDSADYAVDLISDPQWIVPVSDFYWPTTADGINTVIIRFVAGYTTLPAAISHALKLLVNLWFENRASVATARTVEKLPDMVDALLVNHRSFAF